MGMVMKIREWDRSKEMKNLGNRGIDGISDSKEELYIFLCYFSDFS